MPSIVDIDVWIITEVKPDGFMYYKYVLFYVDDVLYISDDPLLTMENIQDKYKLQGYKI